MMIRAVVALNKERGARGRLCIKKGSWLRKILFLGVLTIPVAKKEWEGEKILQVFCR